jgi:hypothetical protein
VTLTDRHRAILDAIGPAGASAEALGRHTRAREFADLDIAGLIVYWPAAQPRPAQVLGVDSRSGTWNLTAEGAEAVGLLAPVRVI